MKNYYLILDVEPTATIEQIKSQHRLLLHAWHPDKFPSSALKSKAEEKVKDINEAYSVLSDPIKRERYNQGLRSDSSPSSPPHANAKQPDSQPTQTQQDSLPKQYCQNCGLPAETKYIEFHENIGMVFMRQYRAVKGNLCKPCIDYYFWNLTGKTMLVGWWGTISFVVTPFILLNNLFRYIFTVGMKKPPLQIAPSTSPFWVFSAIGGFLLGFLLIGYFFISMFFFCIYSAVIYSIPNHCAINIHSYSYSYKNSDISGSNMSTMG